MGTARNHRGCSPTSTARLCGVLFVVIFGSNAFADEADLPEFGSPPKLYTYVHKIGGISSADINAPSTARVTDQLLIGDRTKESLKFHLYTVGTNFHICSLAGSASVASTNKYEYRDENCLLSIAFVGTGVRIEDIEGYCSAFEVGHCGFRTSIGARTLTPTSLQKSEFWQMKMKASPSSVK